MFAGACGRPLEGYEMLWQYPYQLGNAPGGDVPVVVFIGCPPMDAAVSGIHDGTPYAVEWIHSVLGEGANDAWKE